jgi:hypothetical protein
MEISRYFIDQTFLKSRKLVDRNPICLSEMGGNLKSCFRSLWLEFGTLKLDGNSKKSIIL